MEMKIGVILLCFGFLICGAYSEESPEVKKGAYPYMAFIYYSDPSIMDVTGTRFIRSAVLIRPDWLVTSALGPSVIGTPNGFPQKTLLARVGAVAIDAALTLNEDMDEQEREVIQVVRPMNQTATQWWTTDISLLKTLLPFNMTAAVNIKIINSKVEFEDKSCIILVFTKRSTNSTEKVLSQVFVQLLPRSLASCGSHYADGTMLCAADADTTAVAEPDFCHGNSGGPLICKTEIVGLQTYIGNDCKPPHLYQLLSAWDNLITCGIEDKCHEEQCAHICDVIHKDPPTTPPTKTPEISQNPPIIAPVSNPESKVYVPPPTVATTSTEATTEAQTETEAPTTTAPTCTTTETTTEETTTSTKATTNATTVEKAETVLAAAVWPKHKMETVKLTDNEAEERPAKVEARQQRKKKRSAAQRAVAMQTVVFGALIILCV